MWQSWERTSGKLWYRTLLKSLIHHKLWTDGERQRRLLNCHSYRYGLGSGWIVHTFSVCSPHKHKAVCNLQRVFSICLSNHRCIQKMGFCGWHLHFGEGSNPHRSIWTTTGHFGKFKCYLRFRKSLLPSKSQTYSKPVSMSWQISFSECATFAVNSSSAKVTSCVRGFKSTLVAWSVRAGGLNNWLKMVISLIFLIGACNGPIWLTRSGRAEGWKAEELCCTSDRSGLQPQHFGTTSWPAGISAACF